MKAFEFVKKELEKAIERFDFFKFLYEFDEFSDSHFVKVLPASLFKEDKSYIDFEMKLQLAFIEQFPYENLTFITDGSLYKMGSDPILVKGKFYDLLCPVINFDYSFDKRFNLNVEVVNILRTKVDFDFNSMCENLSFDKIFTHSSFVDSAKNIPILELENDWIIELGESFSIETSYSLAA